MQIVYPRCAAIDVGKKEIAVCVRTPGDEPGGRRSQVRKYKTFYGVLKQMCAWLTECGVTHVAMEATGVIWGNEDQRLCSRRSRSHVRVRGGKVKAASKRGRSETGSALGCLHSRRSPDNSSATEGGTDKTGPSPAVADARRRPRITGIYSPVFHALAEFGDFEVIKANPAHVKNPVAGRKTDASDCAWLAELLECGLVRGSYIPAQKIAELRDLTRYRAKLVGSRTSEIRQARLSGVRATRTPAVPAA